MVPDDTGIYGQHRSAFVDRSGQTIRTGTTQIRAVAPWFDITNSFQRYWIRTHSWRSPQHSAEYPPELFQTPAEQCRSSQYP